MRKFVSTLAIVSLSVMAAACSKKAEETTEAVAEPEAVMNETVVNETVSNEVNAADAMAPADNAMNSAANAVDTAAPSQNNGNPIGGR
jgi:uncharacterized lipoprotein YajG